MNEKKQICSTCANAIKKILPGQVTPAFECHGGPPSLVFTERGVMSIFPLLPGDAWCGLHKAKEPSVVIPIGGGHAA